MAGSSQESMAEVNKQREKDMAKKRLSARKEQKKELERKKGEKEKKLETAENNLATLEKDISTMEDKRDELTADNQSWSDKKSAVSSFMKTYYSNDLQGKYAENSEVLILTLVQKYDNFFSYYYDAMQEIIRNINLLENKREADKAKILTLESQIGSLVYQINSITDKINSDTALSNMV